DPAVPSRRGPRDLPRPPGHPAHGRGKLTCILAAMAGEPLGGEAGRVQPPEPVPDLAWDSDRARRFADQAVELWADLLKRLPTLPVSGAWNSEQVAAAVARPIPDEPLPDDELFDYL